MRPQKKFNIRNFKVKKTLSNDSKSNNTKSSKDIPFHRDHQLELTIQSLSNHGDGIARIDIPDQDLTAWVIFVPFTIPGETVLARITSNKKNCSLAEVVRVITPSPHRVTPVCNLFQACGGCQYQHLDYPQQLHWKTHQVADLLKHLAGLDPTKHPVNPAIASPKTYNYRSKLTPHFRKPYNGKISNIGFVSRQGGKEYLDITTCPIAMQEINDALPPLRQKTHSLAKQHKKDTTLLLRASDSHVEADPSAIITEHVGDLKFNFLASDFFQNNPSILPAFTNYAAQQATASGSTYLIDAYCGSGLFALTLAKHFKQVAGVEVSETSVSWARQNAILNNITNTEFTAASAEAIFQKIDFPPAQTTILIDPPRAGCSTEFLDQLFTYQPATCIYISCEPATQMRDLQKFQQAGYTIQDIQPFDLFPQTRHLECIITLTKT
ncbi:MAG: class I SAM-dependent RNA methyltransferase [Akkermansiaceae bacterium]